MDWKNIITEICASGMTQRQVAAEVGIAQPSLCDIANGHTKSPSWPVGDALLRIHDRVIKAKKRAERKGVNHG
jgi:predicted XRE-type DNA-binding protein